MRHGWLEDAAGFGPLQADADGTHRLDLRQQTPVHLDPAHQQVVEVADVHPGIRALCGSAERRIGGSNVARVAQRGSSRHRYDDVVGIDYRVCLNISFKYEAGD
jgi:hypothetical protein